MPLAFGAVFLLGLMAGAVMGPALPVHGNETPVPTVSPVQVALPLPSRGYPAELIRINDGDTFEARVQVWPGMQAITKVRLRGIDTPEMAARCAEEYQRANAARDALQAILAEGGIVITRVDLDKYGGRVLAEVGTAKTGNVSEALLRAGHGRRYEGGRRDTWCRGASN